MAHTKLKKKLKFSKHVHYAQRINLEEDLDELTEKIRMLQTDSERDRSIKSVDTNFSVDSEHS